MATRRTLEREGFIVDVAVTANDGQALAFVGDYDAIILDLGLPDKHGIAIVQALRREHRTTPILVLTGTVDSQMTVRALEAGVDDYVTKPFHPEEFNARVRALVRRGGAQRMEDFSMGNVVLNRLSRQLLISGKETTVTAKEFLLLEHLLLHAKELVTRTDLLEKVWETDFDRGSNVVDVNVSRLRKKLREAGAKVHIESRRGSGFILSSGEDEPERKGDGR